MNQLMEFWASQNAPAVNPPSNLIPTVNTFVNFAGKIASCHFVSLFPTDKWVIDSSASDHMISHTSNILNIQSLIRPCPIKLLNGETVSITQSDTLPLSPNFTLANVLIVPQFKLPFIY